MLRPTSVNPARAVCLAVVRLAAAGLIAVGGAMVANRLLFAVVGNGDLKTAWTSWMGNGESHGIFAGLPLLALGLALAFAGRRLTRWIVTPPEPGCPRCGFEVAQDAAVCPECGQRGLTPS